VLSRDGVLIIMTSPMNGTSPDESTIPQAAGAGHHPRGVTSFRLRPSRRSGNAGRSSPSGTRLCLSREIRCRGKRRSDIRQPGFPGKQDLPDQFQFRVRAFEFVGTVYAGKLQRAREGYGAADGLAGPNGKACVAVEGHRPLGKWLMRRFSRDTKSSLVGNPIKPSATITAGG